MGIGWVWLNDGQMANAIQRMLPNERRAAMNNLYCSAKTIKRRKS